MVAPTLEFSAGQARALLWLSTTLDESEFSTLSSRVKQARSKQPFPLILRDFAGGTGSQAEMAESAARTLVSLRQFLGQSDHSPSELAVAVAAALEIDEAEREVSVSRIQAALSWEALYDYARASDLLGANQNLLWDSRILTDLRPLYPEEGDDAPAPMPEAGLVVHTLELTYWDGSQVSNFYVAMDRDELRGLKRVIEWALKKDVGLESFMSTARLPRVGVEGGEE